ncbi:MAG: hypothetical protein GY944_29570 [bacterium]|nr:hypothetical protein [bacterium]
MTALSADKARGTRGVAFGHAVGVKDAEVIYVGALVMYAADGYLAAAADTASLAIAGVATQAADNTSGADGALTVTVERGHVEKFVGSGLAITQQGMNVFVLDDATVTDAAGATNDLMVGTLIELDGTDAWVLVGVFANVDS